MLKENTEKSSVNTIELIVLKEVQTIVNPYIDCDKFERSQIVKRFTTDFCANSTIPGLHYIAGREFNWIEKLFWFLAVCISFSLCGWSIHILRMDWIEHPTVIEFNDDNPGNAEAFKLPAITVCRGNKCSVNEALNASNFNPNSFITDCVWMRNENDCDNFFDFTVTARGCCYTFNSEMTYTNRIATELQRAPNLYKRNYTHSRMPKTGSEAVFSFRIEKVKGCEDFNFYRTDCNEQPELCEKCNTNGTDTFTFSVHAPNEVSFLHKAYEFQLSTKTTVSIDTTLLDASTSLREYKLESRKCYFDDEMPLQLFKSYTKSNCELECLFNYTVRECGCADFFLPRDNATLLCENNNSECIRRSISKHTVGTISCNCLPLCVSNQNLVMWRSSHSNIKSTSHSSHITFVEFIFKNPKLIPLKLSGSSTWSDFFGNCGGLIGLFIGLSFISFIEIAYFCSIKLLSKKWKPYVATVNRSEKFFRKTVQEFYSNSTLHGCRYLAGEDRHWFEKCFWWIAILLSTLVCTLSIQNLWTDWSIQSTVLDIDPRLLPVDVIPYPAITVCSFEKDNIVLANQSTFEAIKMQQIMGNFTAIDDISRRFQNAGIPYQCTWNNDELLCENHFHFTLTDNGLCFTFNSMDPQDIYSEDIAPIFTLLKMNISKEEKAFNKENYFRSASTNIFGFTFGKFTLDEGFEDPIIGCDQPKMAIMIHGQNEIPSMLQDYSELAFNVDVKVKFDPVKMGISDNILEHDLLHRKCYVENERKLRFFKQYTELNCKVECLSNYTKSKCTCVAFFMPHDNVTRVCSDADELECTEMTKNKSNSMYNECQCFPPCSSIHYNAEISQGLLTGGCGDWWMEFRFFLKKSKIMTILRMERLSWTKFFADCGGYFGLYLGASLLSFVEVIYYFSIRALQLKWQQKIDLQRELRQIRSRPTSETRTMNVLHDTILQPMKRITMDLCSMSSVHGMQYFSKKESHWTGTLWWLTAVGASIVLSYLSISNLWSDWMERPTVIDFGYRPLPTSEIDFPAVTFCPQVRSMDLTEEIIFDFKTDPLSIINYEEILGLLQAASEICPSTFNITHDDYIDDNILDSIYNVIDPAKLFKCLFNQKERCFDFFQVTLTEQGFCHTFNSLKTEDIYTDEIAPAFMFYLKEQGKKANASGFQYDLDNRSGLLSSEYTFGANSARIAQFNYRSNGGFSLDQNDNDHSYKVTFHAPNEIPSMLKGYFHMDFEQSKQFKIDPLVIQSSDNLRAYQPKYRQCYFENERQLRFFRNYTETNCRVECLSNVMKAECECVKFYLPRDNMTRICGPGKKECTSRVTAFFEENHRTESPRKVLSNKSYSTFDQCNCLPFCTQINYDIDVTDMTQLKRTYVSQNTHIFFKNQEYIPLIRSERFTWTQFIANCGGIFGLFMGASLFSVVELIYYCFMKLPIIKCRKHPKN